MMEIIICGLSEVDEYIDDADAVISIMNPGYTIFAPQSILTKESENRHSVLRLEFDDIWQEIYQQGQELVTTDMINETIDFGLNCAQQYDDSILLIHCHEGISRSTGIALAILTALTNDISKALAILEEQRPQAKPNIEILRLTDEILNLNGDLVQKAWDAFYF